MEIFRQIGHARLDLVMNRMALLVGRTAQRDEAELQARQLEPAQLLGDERLRQTRIAFEHDDDFFRQVPPSMMARRFCEPGSSQSPTRSVMFSRPSSLSLDVTREGGARSGSCLSALAISAGIFRFVRQQYVDDAEFGGAPGADELFLARRDARHDEGRLVEGQYFAEGVVAAHADDGARAGDQIFHAIVEFDDLDIGQRRTLFDQLAPFARRHERPEHDQHAMLQRAVMPIGVEDIVDEVGAVAAAAGGDEDIVAFDLAHRHIGMRQVALQEADIAHARADRLAERRGRSADRRNRRARRPRSNRRTCRSCAGRRACAHSALSRCGASMTSRRPRTSVVPRVLR